MSYDRIYKQTSRDCNFLYRLAWEPCIFCETFHAPKIFLHFYNNILKLKPAKQIVNCANCNANIVFNSPGMHVIVLKWSF